MNRAFTGLVLVALLAACRPAGADDDAGDDESPVLQTIEEWPLESIPEPSGLCFGPAGEVLYVVSDDGTVAVVDDRGAILRSAFFKHRDFEGAAFDSGELRLLVLDEGEGEVLFLNPESLAEEGSAKIPGRGEGTFEGIAWLNEGTVAVVNQIHTKARRDAGITLIDDWDGGTEPRFVATGIRDQSGITMHPVTGSILVISDEDDVLCVLDEEMEIETIIHLSGDSQEGIAADGRGRLYIARDSGGILVVRDPWFSTE